MVNKIKSELGEKFISFLKGLPEDSDYLDDINHFAIKYGVEIESLGHYIKKRPQLKNILQKSAEKRKLLK